MADDAPTDACTHVRSLLPQLALGEVTPVEEAEVDAHLATCAACRAEHDALLAVVADVGQLAPPVEPGPALVERLLAGRPETAAARATAAATPPPSPAAEVETGREPSLAGAEVVALDRSRREGSSPRRRVWVAAAAALVALVLGLAAGVALGRTTGTDDRLTALDRVGVDAVRSAVLQGSGGPGGSVVVTGGDDPVLVMSLDHVAPGVRYGCALRTADGDLVAVGSWTPATADDRSWAVPLPAGAPADATAVVLTDPDGRALAEGPLA